MTFASRQDAGRRLGKYLQETAVEADCVLGLPRGGVVVAAEVASCLHCPLAALIVRKLGHPWHREFAVGALAEAGVVILDEDSIGLNPLVRADLKDVIEEETLRLRDYVIKFHGDTPPNYSGQSVLIVDDGLATGATAEAAVSSARKQGARRVLVAAPVASVEAAHRLQRVADQLIALQVLPKFQAVGRHYIRFEQTTDEEVVALLRATHSVH